MQQYKLSIGQGIDLYNKCVKLLSGLNYRTSRETMDILFTYLALAERQFHKQYMNKDGEIFGFLANSLNNEVRIANKYYRYR